MHSCSPCLPTFLVAIICVGALALAQAAEPPGAAAMKERLRADLTDARQAIAASNLDAAAKQDLSAKADGLAATIEALPDTLPPDFRTIMPFCDVQAGIFALHSPLRAAAGFPALTAWATSRWDPLMPTQAPAAPPAEPPALRVAMMRGEHRAAAFNLTSSTTQPLTLTVSLTSLPGGDNPTYVSVHEALFTDTYVRQPIAAALPPAAKGDRGYQVNIPAGMTRQVWLSFHPTELLPGLYQGAVMVTGGPEPIRMPLSLRLYPLDFPKRPSLALCGWDYTADATSAYDGAIVDQPAFIAKLREYGVNTPWGSGCGQGAEFDAEGNMTKPPDFAAFDAWVAKWPGAKYYATFGLSEDLAGVPPGSPVGKRRIAQWLTALTEHMRAMGLEPSQLLVLLVDEPRAPEHDADFIAWGEAVREANSGVRLWEDPCHEDAATADPRVYELSDTLCPSGARFVGSPQSYRDVFAAWRDKGKELWFYNCVNGKHLDPITYHRGTFWLAIRYGARGVGFWAFGDEGRSGSSFRAYASPGHMFSPLFLDPELGIITGKHMEAIREGVQDFETFVMLRERVAELAKRGVSHPAVARAQALLTEGPERVTRDITIPLLGWSEPKDREVMDQVRVEALDALEELGNRGTPYAFPLDVPTRAPRRP